MGSYSLGGILVCPFAIVEDTSQELLSGIAGISCRLDILGDGSLWQEEGLAKGTPSVPRPDGSKLQIAEAENWQTNHL